MTREEFMRHAAGEIDMVFLIGVAIGEVNVDDD